MDGTESTDRSRQLPEGVRAADRTQEGRRYMYRTGEILCRREDYRGELREKIDAVAVPWEEWQDGQPSTENPLPDDVHPEVREAVMARRAEARALRDRALAGSDILRFVIPPLKEPGTRTDDEDIPGAIDKLQAAGRDLSVDDPWPVYPNVVLAGEDDDGVYGPAVAAQPLPDPLPPLEDHEDFEQKRFLGTGVRVAVIDTGLREDHVWLSGRCHGRPAGADNEILDATAPLAVRDYEAGHGTFIAGVIAREAPAAEIEVRGVLDENGLIDDAALAGAISALDDGKPFHLLNLSIGGYVHGPIVAQGTIAPRNTSPQSAGLPATALAIEQLQETTRRRHGVNLIVVAAAGNNGSNEPFYPAALPTVIGVGALDQNGNRATWSNFGGWVDAWEVGEDITSSFVGPELNQPGGGGTGSEGAIWSGTSFAAPKLTGLLAAAMGRRQGPR